MRYTKDQLTVIRQIIDYGAAKILDRIDDEFIGYELHNVIYNEDYFIIGVHEAKQTLNKYDVFDAIDKISEYQKESFGTEEICTNPETIVNMLAYIIGEEILHSCKTINKKWDKPLTKKDLKKVILEMYQAIDKL